mmetsp:Transcript_163624/g.302357  ORF Transcript_163624/g.302357 Transcript_163624/m.302357 type:complete len:275 (+) Transcript_163624:278-1102(+)
MPTTLSGLPSIVVVETMEKDLSFAMIATCRATVCERHTTMRRSIPRKGREQARTKGMARARARARTRVHQRAVPRQVAIQDGAGSIGEMIPGKPRETMAIHGTLGSGPISVGIQTLVIHGSHGVQQSTMRGREMPRKPINGNHGVQQSTMSRRDMPRNLPRSHLHLLAAGDLQAQMTSPSLGLATHRLKAVLTCQRKQTVCVARLLQQNMVLARRLPQAVVRVRLLPQEVKNHRLKSSMNTKLWKSMLISLLKHRREPDPRSRIGKVCWEMTVA